MHLRLALATLAALIGLGGAAQAELYAAGPAYNGSPGGVTCRVFNYGLSNVAVTTRQLWSSANASLAVTGDTCGAVLAPGHSCAYSATVPGNVAFSCRIVTTGTDEKISGVIEIFNVNGTYFSLPLHK